MKDRTTVLRQYTREDIPMMVDKLEIGIKALPHYRDIVFDREVCKATLEFNVGVDGAFIGLVICDPKNNEPVGGISAVISRGFVSRDLFSSDVIMWIEPEWRSLSNASKCIQAFIVWSLARGVKRENIRAGVSGGFNMPGMDKLMRYMGFEAFGINYRLTR